MIHHDDLSLVLAQRQAVGRAADEAAARAAFGRYRSGKAENTLRAQDVALAAWARFLAIVGITTTPAALAGDPSAWQGVTWGLVTGFEAWALSKGYALGTVRLWLSVVRVYARLAAQAGAIGGEALALIQSVSGPGQGEGRRIDERRPQARVGRKAAAAVLLSGAQVAEMKRQPDTPQGRRDGLLVCLLADHGLRVGEAAGLRVEDVDLAEGVIRFWRNKVGIEQRHELTADTRRALQRYAEDVGAEGPLLRRTGRDQTLGAEGISARNLSQRIRELGRRIGVEGLSAHDLRHYWATAAARAGTPIDRLQQAGGWRSPAMPLRYVAAAEIANEGVLL